MIRIMHIAQAPGGVERYLYVLIKKLNKENYENILICSQSYDIEKFKNIVSSLKCIKMYREINLFNEIKAIIEIRKMIKKYHPDIVYMHSSKAGAISRIANMGIKNISIYNAHGWSFNMKANPIKLNLYAIVERILSPFCTKIIAISDFEKESALKKHICKSDKIKIIYNGIDFDEYRQKKQILDFKALGIPEAAYVIGYVGRLTQQKSPDVFVKTARLVKEKIPSAFFLMVGDGDERDEIEALIRKSGLENSFLITGWVDNPLEYIKRFNVATLLSRWEGFGLVLPEYMLEEKPIVATFVDAIPNIIESGQNGILVEPDNCKAAADAIFNIYKDNELEQKLKKNALLCVQERFNADRVAREHEQLFDILTKHLLR